MYQLSRGSANPPLNPLLTFHFFLSFHSPLCPELVGFAHGYHYQIKTFKPAYLSSRLSLHLQTLDIESSPSSLGSSLSLALSAQVTALPANEPITTFKSTKVYFRYQTFSVDVG